MKRLFKVVFDSNEKDGDFITNADSVNVIADDAEKAIRKAKKHVEENKLNYVVNSVVVIGTIDVD